MKRMLVYMDAKSSKFWNIEVTGCEHTVCFGRTGTSGQSKTKSFPDARAALKDAEKSISAKLKKGYVEAEEPAAEGDIPFVAFSNVVRINDIYSNVATFVGKRVVDYDPEKTAQENVVYRFRSNWDEESLIPHLTHFMATPSARDCKALVVGAWQGDDSSVDSGDVVKFLVENASKLPELQALYLGDIVQEENEMSWIQQSDLSPLLQAFPKLQLLRSRGGEGLELKSPSHPELRALAMESGGMDGDVIQALAGANFPRLEYLELWLGTDDYGGTVSVEDLEPLLSGNIFPSLKYLGLRNCETIDEIVQALVESPIVSRIETLDLSLGTLSDLGGQALLKLESPTLKKLVLYHHYMTPSVSKKLSTLPFAVDISNPSDMDVDEEDRFVAVGE